MTTPLDTKAARIAYARKAMKWSESELAAKVGAGDRSVKRWEKGETKPADTTLQKLAEVTGFNFDWLETGEGEMKSAPPTVAEEAPAYNNNNESSPLRRVRTTDADAGDPYSGTVTLTVEGHPVLDLDVTLRQFYGFELEIGKGLGESLGFELGRYLGNRDPNTSDPKEKEETT